MRRRDLGQMYLVECYWPGVTEHALTLAAERARLAALELETRGRRLAFLGSILVPADETVFWFFDGVEKDVRLVSAQAGIQVERVLASVRIDVVQGPGSEGGGQL
ncbi:MAG: hypothetical protein ACRDJO_03895 [Actinomycetota bacterium]